MIKKLFLLAVMMMIATSVYALNETADNGPQNITVCYATGTTAMTSGNVVVMYTTADQAYPGKQVTGSSTTGQKIYGVVVDSNTYTPAEMSTGKYIRVQTYGYCPIIKVDTDTGGVDVAVSDGLYTSASVFRAASNNAALTATGNVTALSVATDGQATATVEGFIGY